MTDRANDLARYLVVDAARRSTALRRYFITKVPEPQSAVELAALPLPGCWPVLTEDEISLGFAMATNVIRNAGFPAEAAQLSILSEVHGHG
ncbi:hypothetical protein [Methylobacterium sp. V23]|uniref:hypothetical protein n=1 Tax=Methylobacterium sp. V23 TaxID=2044878 RepID=UPI000CDB29EF|nr:hypothetical protein [Methylobacterium sp. V23]POR42660.1 hypothetical protein CRT23_12850 [Methylobacterium sp. V23]